MGFRSGLKPKGVKVIYRSKELEEQQGKSWIWNETWMSSFFYKPYNYELFVKQSLNMEMAFVMAREAGMEWIIHLNTDGLIHPAGAHEYFLRQFLSELRAMLSEMISRNLLVSLKSFSVNFASEVKLEEAAVLHYTYPKFSDLTTRCDLCGCKPTLEDVKRCSMLEFNRDAFISVSTVTEEEVLHWSQERILWTDEALKLLRKGILTRIYAPMVVVHGLRESGVFSSVIASTQNFLSSVKNSNSSMTAGVISSRKIGHGGESQATARRILRQCFYFYSNSTSLLLAWKIFT